MLPVKHSALSETEMFHSWMCFAELHVLLRHQAIGHWMPRPACSHRELEDSEGSVTRAEKAVGCAI
jgi:hypothetical protein